MVKASFRPSSAFAAVFGAGLLAWGCAQVAGLDDGYEPFPGGAGTAGGPAGGGGTGGAPGGGGTGGGGAGQGGSPILTDNMPAIAKPGEPCAELGRSACFGQAQKLVLTCAQEPPQTGPLLWKQLEYCRDKDLCDSRPRSEIGANSGTCQPPVQICLGNQPGAHVCDGKTHHICGPDLVSSVTSECASEVLCALTLASGMTKCAVCKAGAIDCDGDSRRSCNQDQLNYTYLEDCSAQQPPLFCNASTGQCDENKCDAGDYACDGQALQACLNPKVGFTTQQICAAPNPFCDATGGQCDLCLPGQARCVGSDDVPSQRDDREVCAPDGQSFVRADCAAPTPFCRDNALNGTCVQCEQDADCAAGSTPCNPRTCNTATNVCVSNPVTGPLPASFQVDGDCKTRVCNAGVEGFAPDTGDEPPDGDGADCLRPACEPDGDLGDEPLPANTPCGPGGTGFCGTEGVCGTCAQGQVVCNDDNATLTCQPNGQFGAPVPCTAPTPYCDGGECHPCTQDQHCPPPSGECKVSSCADNNVCVEASKPDNELLPDNTPNDCKARVCLGGQPTPQPDPNDLPLDADANDCLIPSCNDGEPQDLPRAPDAPCSLNGVSGTCDDKGVCVTMEGNEAGAGGRSGAGGEGGP
ncbi:MAG TPA: hypothetical protein VFS43_42805 [Polyangiaceae bacterium]|nr:hypothetical protein [Polyangiaceae bacterium]